jgi:NADH-quinone oxidoreductase subunit C
MTQDEICAQLKAQFGEAVGPLAETKGDRFVVVKGDKLVEVCRYLKGTTGLDFDYCQDITAVDWPARKVIEVVFHLYSLSQRHGMVLKVETDREQPSIATVEGVWKAATWLEREIYDLFGVKFIGHSDLRRILLPDDWVGHPLRKDYQEAGGYHGIGNQRPDPLVQLGKVTDEKRKAVAAAFAAAAPAVPAAAAAAPAVPAAAAVAPAPAGVAVAPAAAAGAGSVASTSTSTSTSTTGTGPTEGGKE